MPRSRPVRTLRGVAAAPGLSAGPAVVWRDTAVAIPRATSRSPVEESQRLATARRAAREQISQLKVSVSATASPGEAAIFDAHLMFLDDATLLEKAQTAIDTGTTAEAAWMDGIEFFAAQLARLPDPTLQARAADVRDVGRRVLDLLLGRPTASLDVRAPSVIVARDLAPSQIASLPVARVLAFCTAEGGPTSHTAILAKAWGKPAVVALGTAALEISDGVQLLVDGSRGEVVVDPDEETAQAFVLRRQQSEHLAASALASSGEPAVTLDRRRIEIAANIGSVEDAARALEYGAEGVGLLRTEFLYLERQSPPTEEDHLAAYKAILQTMGTRPVIARTQDIGGDKTVPYLDLPKEANPFLGWRAIRISLDRPEVFAVQLRALWRASPGHDLRIMFPMIATPDELRAAKAALDRARLDVAASNQPVAARVQVGMMVEVPSAAVLADQFAREVDFFSIGTNDLTQYTLAADRTNERVVALNDACHPAVLRLIHQVVESGHRENRWVGVCGELAADADAVPLLLGLGVDELSMAPQRIPAVKAIVRQWSYTRAQQLARQALAVSSAAAVRALVRETSPA
ncbi:MAG TPA: phosphoenolpyruvate--protein phosphotransferase [bacterium]|nr:phosphoenolpyruvate--protein phosphotransferase [bacterium]